MFCTSMGNKTVDEIDLTTMSEKVKILVGGVPRPLAVTKDEKTLYVELSDLHGFVIADIPERRVVQTVHLPPVPLGVEPLEPHTPTHGLALSQHDRELWVAGVVDNGVYVYDIPTKKLSRKIPTGNAPIWLAISPDGRYCCVSNAGSDDCSIIDTQTRKEVARLKVGKMPKRLVVVEASR
jgi:YVTN family beta-propeller protein